MGLTMIHNGVRAKTCAMAAAYVDNHRHDLRTQQSNNDMPKSCHAPGYSLIPHSAHTAMGPFWPCGQTVGVAVDSREMNE